MTIKQVFHRLNRRDFRFFPKISTPLKIFLVILFVFSTVLLSQKIFAQETNPIKEKQDAMMKGNNQEAWLDNAMGSNLMSLQVMLAGTFPDEILEERPENLDTEPGIKMESYRPGGLIGVTNKIIGSTFNTSASGILYIAQLKDNFLGKPVYAADSTGFESLNNIIKLWKMSRNIVYVLISLYFIVLGIMIMLRIKISPQAVITVQSSLPKVITVLILVTFSYAIAGLTIDFINFLQPFAISLLFNTLKDNNLKENLFPLSWGDWSLTNLVNAIQSLFAKLGIADEPFSYASLVNPSFNTMMSMITRLAPNIIILLLGATIGSIFGGITGVAVIPVAAAGGALLASAVVALIVMIYIFKLVFNLAKVYITILLNIIFAPFIIFMGIFPGSKEGFSKWLTTLIANLIVFPAVLLFLIIANILSQGIHGGLWAPQLISGQTWFLPIIFGIAAIAITSKLPTLIPEAVFSIKPSPFGKAIGESLKGPVSVAKFGARGAAQYGADVVDKRFKSSTSPSKGLTFLNSLRKTAATTGIIKNH